jgi:hypothetical protein
LRPSRTLLIVAILSTLASLASAKDILEFGGLSYYKIGYMPAGAYGIFSKGEPSYSTQGLPYCWSIIKGDSARRLRDHLADAGYNVTLDSTKALCLDADALRIELRDGMTVYYDGQWLIGEKSITEVGNYTSDAQARYLVAAADTDLNEALAELSRGITSNGSSVHVMDVIHAREMRPQWISVYESSVYERPALLSTKYDKELSDMLSVKYPQDLKVVEYKSKAHGGEVAYNYYSRDETPPREMEFGRVLMVEDADSIFRSGSFLDMFLFLDYYTQGITKEDMIKALKDDISANIAEDTSMYANMTYDSRFSINFTRRITVINNYTDYVLPREEANLERLNLQYRDIQGFYSYEGKMLQEMGAQSVAPALYADERTQQREILSSGILTLSQMLEEDRGIIEKAYSICYQRLAISLNEQAHDDNMKNLDGTRQLVILSILGVISALIVPLIIYRSMLSPQNGQKPKGKAH